MKLPNEVDKKEVNSFGWITEHALWGSNSQIWLRRWRVSKSLRTHSQTRKHWGREWFGCVTELTAPYFDVFYTVHYFIFYYNFYYYFSWFSDTYAVPSKRGTEALIKSFFQLASKIMVRKIIYLHRYIAGDCIKSVRFPVLFLKMKPKSLYCRTFVEIFNIFGNDYALKSNNEIREKMSG